MAIKQKLDDEDIALLEIVEDPIWLGEFLRSSNDGETEKALHPPNPWYYRDYQRQFLGDDSEYILYTGGRAIGKCQPASARVLTDKGYQTITQLLEEDAFIVYSLTPDMTVEQRRAIVTFDKETEVFQVITDTGHKIDATANHPILTPKGYVLLQDLSPGDYIAVTTHLPHESTRSALSWAELRILGYIILKPKFRAEHQILPRYKKIGAELEAIADRMLLLWHKDRYTGAYSLKRKPGPFRHPITSLLTELRLFHPMRQYGAKRIPVLLKQERLENIQVFLEAVFAQNATIAQNKITLKVDWPILVEDFQELLLRFGIETRITKQSDHFILETLDERAAYRFWQQFNLPGVGVGQLRQPPSTEDATEFMRFDRVASVTQVSTKAPTYAIHVYDTNNYISDNVYVHNSVVLEDKIVYEVVNKDLMFPITQESVLVTPNQAQMTPLLNKIILRFTTSKFLRGFLNNNVNRAEGTMKFFMTQGKPMIFNFRIAGSRGENNMVGLHIPRIRGDEMQLFPLNAFTQLGPTYNGWEPKRQQLYAGVPNGLRNSVLYMLDFNTRYKRYHIPSHMNPFYTFEDDQENIKKYNGEQDDRYQQLVLGRHGSAAFQVIPRESMIVETYPFYSFQYNSGHINKGIKFEDHLKRPTLPDGVEATVIAIDPGFVDSAIIQVFGRTKGVWRTYVRYRLKRIDFNEQQNIIHWIAQFYGSSIIAIDIGAGGNGAAIMHNLMFNDTYKGNKYDKRMVGVQFSEKLLAGYDDEGEELHQDAKGYAANELAQLIQDGRLVFSELDYEGMGELERVAKQKSTTGRDRYFVLSDKGAGADEEDHIFAAYIVWTLATKADVPNPTTRKLAKARGLHTADTPLQNGP
jgi:hypothetical protein